jgi:hypothetical protein
MACKETKTTYDPNQWMSQYNDMMQTAMKSYTPVLAAWTNWYQGMMPPQARDFSSAMASSLMAAMPKGCCDIPATDCPPRCACTITWQASVGEVRKATIELRNTSKESITYQLVTQNFDACGKTIDLKPTVTPASVTAAAGQTVTATVQVQVSEQFHPGATYHSEILVRGKYERCVRLELQMRCEEDAICSFDHGDIPHRIKPDDWYRHFQCSEPCFEPIIRTTTPTNPNTGTVNPNTGATTPNNPT